MAVLALIPSRTRIPVLVVWIVALVAAVTAAVLGAVTLDLPVGEARPGLGFFLVVLRGAFVVAAFIAIHGLATRGPPDRHAAAPAGAGRADRGRGGRPRCSGWRGSSLEGPGELTDDRDTGIPAYMVQDALWAPPTASWWSAAASRTASTLRRAARRRRHHRRGRDPRRHRRPTPTSTPTSRR